MGRTMEKQLVEGTSFKLRRLLVLAEELKRSNLAKLSFGRQDWRDAVAGLETAPDSLALTREEVGNLIRAAGKAASRLGNAGDARFESHAIGRQPDSSSDGNRFHSDLKKAQRILTDLLSLIGSWHAAQEVDAADDAAAEE